MIISRSGSAPKANFSEILQDITRLSTLWQYLIFYSDQRWQRAGEWRWRRNSKILGLVIRLQLPGYSLPTPTRFNLSIKRYIRNDIRPKRNAFDNRIMRQNHKNVERRLECYRRDPSHKTIHNGILETLNEWLWWIRNIIVNGVKSYPEILFWRRPRIVIEQSDINYSWRFLVFSTRNMVHFSKSHPLWHQ